MRTFASADTFIESSQSSLRLGRLVANATFLEALLRHGPYDRFEFFCPTDAEKKRLGEWIGSLPDGRHLGSRVELRSPFELPSRFAEADWEVVHSGGWSRYLPALAWLRARYARHAIPLTGTIHSLNDPSMASMLRRLSEAPLGACDAVICTSRDGRESFRRQLDLVNGGHQPFFGRLEVAPLGVDERYFAPGNKSRSRRKLSVQDGAGVAFWMGRLSAASKADLHPLLYQWRQIVTEASGKDRLLVLAGGGSEGDLKSLRETVAELGLGNSVRIRADIEDSEKLDWLAAANVFVSPVDNHQETFGIALVEAMAAGLPVVASNWDGYKDLVEEGITGFLIGTRWVPPPPDVVALRALLEPNLAQLTSSQGVAVDPSALRKALTSLLDDPDLAQRMGEAGRKKARRSFAWEAVIGRLSDIWADLKRNSQAMAVPGVGRGNDPEILDPVDAFGHYGSEPMGADPIVRISELGLSILQGKIPMPPTFGDLMPISNGKLLTSLVLELRAGNRKLSEHLAACAKVTNSGEEASLWLAHWLLKYGVLEVV